ncbi:MAG: hypothetical protein JWO24_773 [Rhodospirillales bacterium]|nr:hypothetical protein [Rhodospirillales bacterium]
MPLRVVKRPGSAALYLRGTVRGKRVFESTGTADEGLAEEATERMSPSERADTPVRSRYGALSSDYIRFHVGYI